jgi:hypothetical protein
LNFKFRNFKAFFGNNFCFKADLPLEFCWHENEVLLRVITVNLEVYS